MKMKKVAGKFGQTENCVYFCTRISAKGSVLSFKKDRDLAQLVAHTSGGREVAGSSPVIPTFKKKAENQTILGLFFVFIGFLEVTLGDVVGDFQSQPRTIDLSKANYQEVTPVYSTDINNHIN